MTYQNSTNKKILPGTKVALGGDQAGDIYYLDNTNTLHRLGIGGVNQVLGTVAGYPVWIDLGDVVWKNVGNNPGEIPVVGLDGKLNTQILPAIRITSIQVVNDESARLSLTGLAIGDVVKQTDNQVSYILSAIPASEVGNWVSIGDTRIVASDIIDGIIAPERLGNGIPSSQKFLNGIQEWIPLPVIQKVQITDNSTSIPVSFNTAYYIKSAPEPRATTFVFPNSTSIAQVGDIIKIFGANKNQWKIQLNDGHRLIFGDTEIFGVGSEINSTHPSDTLCIECVGAESTNFEWSVVSSVGNFELLQA